MVISHGEGERFDEEAPRKAKINLIKEKRGLLQFIRIRIRISERHLRIDNGNKQVQRLQRALLAAPSTYAMPQIATERFLLGKMCSSIFGSPFYDKTYTQVGLLCLFLVKIQPEL